jgi:Cu/Ag efflux protein CusF
MRIACLLLLALAVLGCGAKEAVGRYPMQGDVEAVDLPFKTATIAGAKIDDWMDAMTMEYPVKPHAELAKLHARDHIEATVVAEGERYYVTDVKMMPKQ